MTTWQQALRSKYGIIAPLAEMFRWRLFFEGRIYNKNPAVWPGFLALMHVFGLRYRDIQADALNGTGFFPHLGRGLPAPDLLHFPDVVFMRQWVLLLLLDVFPEDVHEFFAYRHIALGQQDLQRGVDQIEMDRFIAKTFFSGLKFRLDAGQ